MKTFTLSKKITPEESCDFLRDQLCIRSNRDDMEQSSRIAYASVTGLFMFEKPLCVRTDLGKQMGWSPCKKGEVVDYLPKTLVDSIHRWHKDGTGIPIIHMRNHRGTYTGSTHNRRLARTESFPHKINSESYFYHLGRFGSTTVWNQVASARVERKSVAERIYKYVKRLKSGYENDWRQQKYHNGELNTPPQHWHDTLNDAHMYDGGDARTYRILEWTNGVITYDITNQPDSGDELPVELVGVEK